MEWSTKLAEAEWWVEAKRPFNAHCVGSLIPDGFESVGRLFHPIEHDDGDVETWSSFAERNGRVAHPEMQLHAIGTPVGWPISADSHEFQNHADLDLPGLETHALAKVLSGHTETPDDCWFGVWDGYGDLHRAPSLLSRGIIRRQPPGPGLLPNAIAKQGTVGDRGRQYYLLNGALDEIGEAREMLNVRTPNLWWPADRAWFVASEIDFCWTLVGGSKALIDELIASADLEVFESGYDHRGTFDADTINAD